MVDARVDQQPAPLHLLARRRPARRRDRAGWARRRIDAPAGTKDDESWLAVSAVRAGDEAHRVLGPSRPRPRTRRLARLGRAVRDGRLGGRTAVEALDAGIPPKQVWAAVWRVLELPARPAVTSSPRRSTSRPCRGGTIRTLVVSQAVGAVGVTIGVATASLLARDISGSESMAGLAQTFQVLGTAVAAFLLARLMRSRGRRIGLVTGYLLGAAGALLAVLAGVVDSMVVLLLGAVLLGATTAANSGSRYAATDLAPEETRARALSLVVWATTIGAVAGPNLTGVGGSFARWAGIPELTGGFAIGAVALVLAACWIAVRLRPDPLLVAQAAAPVEPLAGDDQVVVALHRHRA